MKFKLTWPMGIVLSLGAFMIFILSFVYKVMFLPEYDHHLVSKDYYKDELNYQQEINKLNNANALSENIVLIKTESGITVNFPSEFNPKDISGTVSFQRINNSKIDFEMPIELETNQLYIDKSRIVEGRWNVKIEWKVNDKSYLFKQKYTY